jgi:hypothetical protein
VHVAETMQPDEGKKEALGQPCQQFGFASKS